MIEIHNLSHSLGTKAVICDMNLSVADNTILGIVGINGAGKSTLLRLLAGVYLPDAGSITYDGKSPTSAETRKDIFFLPDDPYYTRVMTPDALFEFYKSCYPSIDRQTYDRLLGAYQIDKKGKVRNFSKGMRRQVFIALALAVKPKYLLLDEAFDGLDPLSRTIFKDAIVSLAKERHTTVLIASHSLRELEGFCNRFILIDASTIKSQSEISAPSDKLCKFELAFTEPISEALFADLPVVSLSIKKRFVQVILEGDGNALQEQLAALSPAVMDEIPLDFEETFIHDVRKEGMPT